MWTFGRFRRGCFKIIIYLFFFFVENRKTNMDVLEQEFQPMSRKPKWGRDGFSLGSLIGTLNLKSVDFIEIFISKRCLEVLKRLLLTVTGSVCAASI